MDVLRETYLLPFNSVSFNTRTHMNTGAAISKNTFYTSELLMSFVGLEMMPL
jgi:hypothetical protein